MEQENVKSNGQAANEASTIDTSSLYTNPAELERYPLQYIPVYIFFSFILAHLLL